MSKKQNESRSKIEDLPQAEQELTAEEAKNIQGGVTPIQLGGASGYREPDFNFAIKAGDGSVKPQGS